MTEIDRPRRFAVVPRTMGRCGSTWFCGLLDDHPDVYCLGEVFNASNSERFADLIAAATVGADEFFATLAEHRDASWIGFKAFREQLGDERVEILFDSLDHLFLLERENLTAAVASEMRAKASRVWHRWATDSDHRPPPPIEIDLERMRRRINYAVASGRVVDRIVAATGVEVTRLRYEDLAADPLATMDRVFGALSLPPIPVKSKTRKIDGGAYSIINAAAVDAAFGAEFGYLEP